MKGQVVRILENKGFFFIRGEDGVERFGHQSSLMNTKMEALREGEEVEFVHVDAPKGPRAHRIVVLSAATATEDDPLSSIFPDM